MARVGWAVGLLVAGFVWAKAAAAAEPDPARELFREGNEAFARGDLHTAYDAYQQAWALRRSFDVACNLGRTEAELGLFVAAAEHLEYCLRTFSTSGKGDVRDAERKLRRLFDDVRTKVGALRINSRPVEVEVLVDGVAMGTGPFDHDLFVAPGRHKLVLRASGYRTRELGIEVQAGSTDTVQVRLELEASAPAVGAAAPAAPAVASQPSGPTTKGPASESSPSPARSAELRTVVTLAGAGLTAAGLTLGAAFALDARNAADDTDASRGAAERAGCTSTSPAPECRRYRQNLEREGESRDLAELTLAASGVVGAATIAAWLLLPDRVTERAQGVRPYFNQQGAGVALTAVY